MPVTQFLDMPVLDDSFPLSLVAPFTYAEARTEGLSSRDLAALVDAGLLRRPLQGVYLACQAGDSPLLRAQAIRAVVPQDAVICDRHAGWLHGAEMILAPGEHLALRPISVFMPAGRGRLRNDLTISGERNFTPADITELDGIRVTTPIRTALDLGRTRFPEPSLASLDAMLRLRAFSHQELVSEIGRFRGLRWVRTLRLMAPLADPRAQSPGESVLRLRWIQASVGAPTPQVEVHRRGGLIAVLDLGDEELLYAAEYDGEEWHSSPEQRDHDRDRRDEVRQEGWDIDVFTKVHVFGPRADADHTIRQGVVRARQRLGRRILM